MNYKTQSGMQNVNEHMAREIASAKHSVACFLVASPGVRCYHALLSAAESGLPTDLFLLENSLADLGIAEPYLKRLRAAGGRCFLLQLSPKDWRNLRLAPSNLLLIDEATEPRMVDGSGANPEIDTVRSSFNSLRALGRLTDPDTLAEHLNGPVRRKKSGDQRPKMSVSFSAGASSVTAGRSVRISWAVTGADRVEISPEPGEVTATGESRPVITDDTEFTLTAHRGTQSVSKVLCVNAVPRPTLDYWLLVGENTAGSRARPPAGSPDLPDHFGMSAGLPLTLHWRAQNATLVCLDGVALPTLAGSVTLHPEGLTVYQLSGIEPGGDEVRRSITVNTFRPRLPPQTEPKSERRTAAWVKNILP